MRAALREIPYDGSKGTAAKVAEKLEDLGFNAEVIQYNGHSGIGYEVVVNLEQIDGCIPVLLEARYIAHVRYVQQPSKSITTLVVEPGSPQPLPSGEPEVSGSRQMWRRRRGLTIYRTANGWTTEHLNRSWNDGPVGRLTRAYITQ